MEGRRKVQSKCRPRGEDNQIMKKPFFSFLAFLKDKYWLRRVSSSPCWSLGAVILLCGTVCFRLPFWVDYFSNIICCGVFWLFKFLSATRRLSVSLFVAFHWILNNFGRARLSNDFVRKLGRLRFALLSFFFLNSNTLVTCLVVPFT